MYADVGDKDYGPVEYKKASVLQALEKLNQAKGLPSRPSRETKLWIDFIRTPQAALFPIC